MAEPTMHDPHPQHDPHPHDLLTPPDGWFKADARILVPPIDQKSGLLFRGLSKASSLFNRPEVPDVFKLLNIHRSLFPAWLWFASRLMPFGTLPANIRELLILRTAWNCRSRYEWGQHVEIALSFNMTDTEILAATQADPAQYPDAKIAACLFSCDDLCQHNQISPTHWQQLQQHFDQVACIEIMMLVGHYQMLAGVINTAGLALEPAIEQKLQAFYQRAKSL